MGSRILILGLFLMSPSVFGQNTERDAKVRNDKKTFAESKTWIYNDLTEGIRAAKASNKPMMIVFRCIPCEACQEFDDDVAARDPIIRDLLDKYICVRIVQANTIDLTKFQYDFDQSFAVILANADSTIYGRFATRSDRREEEDISLEGLRKAMAAGLQLHAAYAEVKPSLAGKQVQPSKYKTPLDYPSLAGKFGMSLNYEGKVAQSCMHCHQVREAERQVYRSAGEPIPDKVLYPYPDPSVLGLKLDPEDTAKIETVAPGSIAANAGLKVGDTIQKLDGQPMLSIADVQWVLHNAPSSTVLKAEVLRAGKTSEVSLTLPDGWRHADISWRVTSWDLRRMGLGGLRLEELPEEERNDLKLAPDAFGLRVKHAGGFGAHATAKRAGINTGDVILGFDGLTTRLTESELLAHALQKKKPGDTVEITFLRKGIKKTVTIALQ